MTRATLLAQQMKSQLILVHAIENGDSGRARRIKIAHAQARLLSAAEDAVKAGVPSAEVAVEVASPASAIQAASRKWQPDLIVMARPARSRFDVMLGSTSERVIRTANCPVLIVGGAVQGAYRNVVLATDLSKASLEVAKTAFQMGLLDGAYTWIVHAFKQPNGGSNGTSVEGLLAEHRQHWRRMRSRELLGQLSEAGVDLRRVQLSIEAARPFDAIEKALRESQSQLLVIGTSRWYMLKRILFGSLAEEVLQRLECDVLAISPVKRERRATVHDGASRVGGGAQAAVTQGA